MSRLTSAPQWDKNYLLSDKDKTGLNGLFLSEAEMNVICMSEKCSFGTELQCSAEFGAPDSPFVVKIFLCFFPLTWRQPDFPSFLPPANISVIGEVHCSAFTAVMLRQISISHCIAFLPLDLTAIIVSFYTLAEPQQYIDRLGWVVFLFHVSSNWAAREWREGRVPHLFGPNYFC